MSDKAELFIDCRNSLGEGPFWHPSRGELLWFDIHPGDLYSADTKGNIVGKWNFGEPVAAAALVDHDTILVASATAIVEFSFKTGAQKKIAPLEAENATTRANDSRVSPHGGWWIGTMGLHGEKNAGKVYHYRDGKFTTILSDITIPNSTCFSPDGKIAYFSDSPSRQIRKVSLDAATGLPNGPWEVFVDINGSKAVPDGSVVDSEGCLWNAEYGGGRVVRYTPDGKVDRIVELPCPHVTCPAFGGDDLRTLYITTAHQNLDADGRKKWPTAGSLFSIRVDVPGVAETPIRR